MRTRPTGRLSLYIRFETGYYSKLRPAHDSAADAIGELTDKEVGTLRSIIGRYIAKCHARHGKANLDRVLKSGGYS